jgi:hypothetical protein
MKPHIEFWPDLPADPDENWFKALCSLVSIIGVVAIGTLMAGAWSVGDMQAAKVDAPRFVVAEVGR